MSKFLNSLRWISNAEALHMVEEIIVEHAPRILAELGMTDDNDGILDRIHATLVDVNTEYPAAKFTYTFNTEGFMAQKKTYNRGSGEVYINVNAAFYLKTMKNKTVHLVFTRLPIFRSLLRRGYIVQLAHELRHYWQYMTGEAFKQDMIGTINFMPYEHRWVERDANKFAFEYVKSLSRK